MNIMKLTTYITTYYTFIIILEYDQMIEMMGIPRLAFFKNGKCGRCAFLGNN